ncbi:MAG: Hpt domain-containing protein [Cyanobacteria bacterium P01_F01_bin.150]
MNSFNDSSLHPLNLSALHLAESPSMQHLAKTPEEMDKTTLSHLDWSYLHSLSDADPDFERTLIELFLQDCQEQLAQLKEAIAQTNIKETERIAHYIKGASANIGAQYIQHYAQQIEHQVRHTQFTCFDTEISRLEISLSIVQEIFANSHQHSDIAEASD